TVGNYLVELCQDGTRDPIGCTLIEYRSEGVVEEVINGNEDCLAKCEWAASEDMDGRMDGWTSGCVWTNGHCIGFPVYQLPCTHYLDVRMHIRTRVHV
ncbi:hypothetical protein X777_09559, partial [Ooceraea biroi]